MGRAIDMEKDIYKLKTRVEKNWDKLTEEQGICLPA